MSTQLPLKNLEVKKGDRQQKFNIQEVTVLLYQISTARTVYSGLHFEIAYTQRERINK